MRILLALSVAAVGALLATPAHATCMPLWDKGDFYAYSCSAPGGPVRTTICHRPTGACVSY
ncbi:MAG TPA: hypothetical protein VGX28_12780 [Frankiaceae bacterium]|jgi:hypothetical protein|nr:hypothetical protein [Frankiaceae bacterium]